MKLFMVDYPGVVYLVRAETLDRAAGLLFERFFPRPDQRTSANLDWLKGVAVEVRNEGPEGVVVELYRDGE
jgi:hypothetical protein